MREIENLNSNFDLEDEQEQESNVWLSISDLMSGLLLFFALLFITTQVQLQKRTEELQKKTEELTKYEKVMENLPLAIVSKIEEGSGGNSISVDPKTGDVSLDDKILFDEGESQLKPEGKKFLNQFIPLYSEVIFSNSEFEQEIVRVIIEGHTSSKGFDHDNRDLSLKRALAVSNYIFSEQLNFKNKQPFETKILISGRGEIDANQQIDDPKDRKVVFRFQLRRPDLSNFLNEKSEELIEQQS